MGGGTVLEAPSETLASKLGSAAQRTGEQTARKDGTGSTRRASGGARARKAAAGDGAGTFLGSSGSLRSARVAPSTPREYVSRREPGGLRIRVNGGIPRSLAGRLTVAGVVLVALVAFTGSLWGARAMLLRDPRLMIPSSDHIAILGNSHLSKAQLLSIFGEDVDQNVLNVPLAARQQALESLPWVEHATVMRLMPNRLEVQIVERKPVAFVREGGRIGLVDGHGVLLDMTPGMQVESKYSFPVVTGVLSTDLAETRAARMKLFTGFMASLNVPDAAGAAGGAEAQDAISKHISEVDLSSPEDIRALIPSGGADILVHFGEDDFLARYKRFEKHLPEWRAQFPKLGSVDMRYERDVVLEMQPGTAVPAVPAAEVAAPVADGAVAAHKPAAAAAKILSKPAVKAPARTEAAHAVAAAPTALAPGHHSEVAFDAPVKAKPRTAAKPTVKAAAKAPASGPVKGPAKPAAKTPAKAPAKILHKPAAAARPTAKKVHP